MKDRIATELIKKHLEGTCYREYRETLYKTLSIYQRALISLERLDFLNCANLSSSLLTSATSHSQRRI